MVCNGIKVVNNTLSKKAVPLALQNMTTTVFAKRFFLGSGGIRTHASEETGALNQRLRPLGHATFCGTTGGVLLAHAAYQYMN